MNKKIIIVANIMNKLVLAIFLLPFISVSFITFLVTSFMIIMHIWQKQYEEIITPALIGIFSLAISVILTKPFFTTKEKKALKKGQISRLQLTNLEIDYSQPARTDHNTYYPTLFTFVDENNDHFDIEQYISENSYAKYETSLKNPDKKIKLEVKKYKDNYYLSLNDLIDFRNRQDDEPIATVGLKKDKIK